MLKPGFFKNEDLAKLPVRARLLFAGLWLLADKGGRLEDRPARIRIEIFPYEKIDVEKLLTHLASANFIIRYESEGVDLIQIGNFSKHQNPHRNEPESVTKPPSSTIGGTGPTIVQRRRADTVTRYGNQIRNQNTLVGKKSDPLALLETWNTAARENSWRQCRTLTAERRKKAKSRLHEHDLDWWKQIFVRAGPSAFLREAAWFTLDWLLKNETNAVKVLEGNYDDKQPGNNGKPKRTGTFLDRTAESIARERGLDKP